MRRRGLGAIVGCVAALSLLAAQPAGAATQVGNSCTITAPYLGGMLVGLASSPGTAPAAVQSPGVVTQWTHHLPPESPPSPNISSTLKILRPVLPGEYQIVGEATGSLLGGPRTFPARIPVQPGDLLGHVVHETGNPMAIGSLYCKTENPGDVVGAIEGNPPVGATASLLGLENELQIPVSASVEPDADNDGFGDETQDGCPQLTAAQGPCPTVAVDASSVIKRKGKVIVLVTSDSAAPVTVAGTANLGKKKKAKLGSKPQTVVPGTVSRFTLNFPRKLKKKLKKLARKRSLQLKVTASATDLIGRVTTDTLKTKLKGQAKPQPKGGRR